MGYPDSFEGFMIEDHKKWTEFKKKQGLLLHAHKFFPSCRPLSTPQFLPKPFSDYDIEYSNRVLQCVWLRCSLHQWRLGDEALYPSVSATKSSVMPPESAIERRLLRLVIELASVHRSGRVSSASNAEPTTRITA
jgi:hypothetical protein